VIQYLTEGAHPLVNGTVTTFDSITVDNHKFTVKDTVFYDQRAGPFLLAIVEAHSGHHYVHLYQPASEVSQTPSFLQLPPAGLRVCAEKLHFAEQEVTTLIQNWELKMRDSYSQMHSTLDSASSPTSTTTTVTNTATTTSTAPAVTNPVPTVMIPHIASNTAPNSTPVPTPSTTNTKSKRTRAQNPKTPTRKSQLSTSLFFSLLCLNSRVYLQQARAPRNSSNRTKYRKLLGPKRKGLFRAFVCLSFRYCCLIQLLFAAAV
jgi:hypothetical protein